MVKLGLIGRGAWARVIGATLDSLPDVTWTAMSSPGPFVDGVIIANKSKNHFASALPFVEAGVPCFVEKPLATNLPDFLHLQAISQATGSPVFAGHLHLFNPAAQVFWAALPQIGPLQSATALCANAKPRADTSVIWDWLPHPLSLADHLFAVPPDGVTARRLDDHATAPQHGVARLSYQGGSFDLEASWRAPKPCFRITATGRAGRLVFDDKAEHKVILIRSQNTQRLAYAPDPPLTRELQAFVTMVKHSCKEGGQGGGNNPSPLSAAETMMRSLDAIERSVLAKGQKTKLK